MSLDGPTKSIWVQAWNMATTSSVTASPIMITAMWYLSRSQLTNCESCHTGGVPTENFPIGCQPIMQHLSVIASSHRRPPVLSWDYSRQWVDIYGSLSETAIPMVVFSLCGGPDMGSAGNWQMGQQTELVLLTLYDSGNQRS